MDSLIPIRCKSCNFVIGRPYLFRKFWEDVNRGEEPSSVFAKIGIKKSCCKTIILTHVNAAYKILGHS